MSDPDPPEELRLVEFCRPGTDTRSAASTILGLVDPAPGSEVAVKHRGEVSGRQVVLVSSPSWFSSDCSPEQRRTQISSFITMMGPDPHAFLLCLPVNQPPDGEDQALEVLTRLFGPEAVSSNTLVLFTHLEELEEDEPLEEYLHTWRKDLLEVVGRCGGRYHTLETRGGHGGRALEELLEKLQEMQHLRYQQGEPQVDVDDIFPPTSVSPSAPPPSPLWALMEKMLNWIKALPKLVRRESLLGALVGLLVGGPVGGMVGATVGSVATEVVRRKNQQTKNK